VEEVLERQAPQIQRFLLETSILQRMCGPLCDAVVEDDGARQADTERHDGRAASDAQATLAYLDAANLFVVPLDDRRETSM
jgi:LuxR family maltose regulon positive regulatory protein